MKKRIACVLALLLLCVLPLLPEARAAEVADSGTVGGLTWSLDTQGKLTISGTGDMPYCAMEAEVPWLDHAEEIKSVVIGEGVTSVGPFAFKGCLFLEEVTIPQGVTVIHKDAFHFCKSLQSVTIPDSVQSIDMRAFYLCESLGAADLGQGVAKLGRNAFDMCRSLRELTIPASVTELNGYTFANCDSLTKVTFMGSMPAFVGDVFSGTGLILSVRCYYPQGDSSWSDLENFGGRLTWEAYGETEEPEPEDTPDVPEAIPTSGSCGQNVTWSLDDSGTLTISGKGSMADYQEDGTTAFSQVAKQITAIVVKNGVTRIGDHAFQGCSQVISVSLPDSVTAIGRKAFGGLWQMTQLNLPKNLTTIGPYAFEDCHGLQTVVIPDGVTDIPDGTFADCSSLRELTLPKNLKSIGEVAFHGADLKTLTFPASLERIDSQAFAYSSLQTMVFQGNAPQMAQDCFRNVAATVFYPLNNASWTEAIRQNYGGTLTWVGEGIQVPLSKRLAGSHRYETAFQAADQMKQVLGVEKFDTVVVASGTDFADALSGSYLAAVKNAPILLGCGVEWINDLVKDYIRENLNPGGTVYILGGEKAIGASFAEGLGDFEVKRLAGSNRFLTNLLVLEEAGVGDKPILVSTGLNFADSLSASAARQPILLVYGKQLLPEQETFLADHKASPLYILGGTGAVSAELENQIAAYSQPTRLAGSSRFETSILIAQTFFDKPQAAVLAYAWDFPDGLCGGSLAAAMNAPLILTMQRYEQAASDYIQGQGIYTTCVLGGEKLIPDNSVRKILAMPEDMSIPST